MENSYTWDCPSAAVFQRITRLSLFRCVTVKAFLTCPPTGIKSESDLTRLNGVRVINDLARPGPDVSLYAFDRLTEHRNIFRIPIP